MKLTLGERIALLRKRKGISQAELGKFIGVNADTIDSYEYDSKKIYAENLVKIADVLGVSLDYLTGRIDDELEIKNIRRIIEVQNLPDFPKETAYRAIDAIVNYAKSQENYKT